MVPSPSSSSPALKDQAESLEKSRRRLMIALVATTALWFLPQILDSFVPEAIPHSLKTVLIFLGLIGNLLWLVFMYRFFRYQQLVLGRPELQDRLEDERIGAIRREAGFRGWATLLVFVAVGVGLAPFVVIPVQALLMTLLMVGVTAPLLFFLWLDRG